MPEKYIPEEARNFSAPKEGAPLHNVNEQEIDDLLSSLDLGEAKSGDMVQSEKVIDPEDKV
jgi:hypothetical protein